MRNSLFGYSRNLVMISSAVAIGLAGLAADSPALAKGTGVKVYDATGKATLNISYADLDLASIAGRRTLDMRVSQAVSSICSEMTEGSNRTLEAATSLRECQLSAFAKVRPQIQRAVNETRGLSSTSPAPIAATATTVAVQK